MRFFHAVLLDGHYLNVAKQTALSISVVQRVMLFGILLACAIGSSAVAAPTYKQYDVKIEGPAVTTLQAPATYDVIGSAVSRAASQYYWETVGSVRVFRNGVDTGVSRLVEGNMPPGTYTYQVELLVDWVKNQREEGQTKKRSITITVVVTAPPASVDGAEYVTQSAPDAFFVDENPAVMVQFRNTGNTTWRAGSYFIGSVEPRDNTALGANRIGLNADVAPGGVATFNFTISSAVVGHKTFQWQMLRDAAGWFGAASLAKFIFTNPLPTTTMDAYPTSCTIPYGESSCKVRLTFSHPSTVDSMQLWQSNPDGTNRRIVDSFVRGNGRCAPGCFSELQVSSPGAHFEMISGRFVLGTTNVSAYQVTNQLPAVQLTSPAAGSIVLSGSSVGFSALASDTDDGVQRVEFFVDGTLIGEDTSAPFATVWTAGAEGAHQARARAVDTRGAYTDSATVELIVNPRANTPPTVVLTSPGNGDVYIAGNAIAISGSATDSDDAIQRVEFYADGVLISQSSSAPYGASWLGAAKGRHSITAKAIDQRGASAISGAVAIEVRDPVPSEAGGVRRYYVYDTLQRLCKTIEPETGTTVFGYDEAGNVVWSAAGLQLPDRNNCNRAEASSSGRRVDRTYDARNRLKTLKFPDGRGDQVWTYTGEGLPNQTTTSNGSGYGLLYNTYYYNRRQMLVREDIWQADLYAATVRYNYDGNANLASQSWPSQRVVGFSPNALGQPTEIRDQEGTLYASGVTYYPNGAIRGFTYGNGIAHAMQQNARQLPARSTDAGVLNYGYTYDANGNPVDISDDVQGTAYSRSMVYDGLDRLRQAVSPNFGGDGLYKFSYNANDNLKSATLAGVKDYATYVYDTNNRLTNILNASGASIVGLAYDAQGNLENKSGRTYAFDYGNRLRSATVPGIGTEIYGYDINGRRVAALRDGVILYIYNNQGQLLFSQNKRGVDRPAVEHIYLGGSLIANRETNPDTGAVQIKYQHTDALGSPVAVTNQAGQIIERTQWQPFGEAVGKPAYQGMGFTGHVQDGATGLSYMQQRYYDPGIGRFLSVDPVTAYGGDNRYFNRYWYAAGNPYKYTDPDGRILDTVADIGFIAYSGYKLATEPSWTNAGALAADVVGAAVPFATGLGAGVRAASHGADAAKASGNMTQRAASREAKREAGIPTSQQASSQTNGRAPDGTPVGRQQSYEVPKAGGGTETKSVQVSRDTRGAHAGQTQIEAGTVKPGGQTDVAGRPRIQNEDKVRVDFEPRR